MTGNVLLGTHIYPPLISTVGPHALSYDNHAWAYYKICLGNCDHGELAEAT
uniref:Uncharacterized protein n=1 Tax=Arundo donax TaxID=35708 RepID=A0A0A9BMK7_ARUDO